MTQANSYRIETAVCPDNPRYYRWTVFENDRALDLPGYAYASAWSASEAARVALKCHLILEPFRSKPSMDGRLSLSPVAADPKRDAA